MKLTNCPRCDSNRLGDEWVGPGRSLRQYCYNCIWCGQARIPEQLEVKTTRQVPVVRGGFEFEVFDRYGHITLMSMTYNNKEEAKKEIERNLEFGRTDKEAGPYKAVLWPAYVEAKGQLFE